MSFDQDRRIEMESLLARFNTETLTDEEKRRLADLLRHDPDAIDAYLDHTEMEAMLRETYGLLNLPHASLPRLERDRPGLSPRWRPAMAAAALLAVAIGALMLWSAPWKVATDQPSPTPGRPVHAPSYVSPLPPVATVAHNGGAELYHVGDGGVPVALDEAVRPGRYELRNGVLELDYESGATLTLQAPVHFELQSANRVVLVEGRLAVRCPTKESKGFSVETPNNVAVDLGTEFAVEVGPDDHGSDEFHVFSGEVVVKSKSDRWWGRLALREGQASRMDHRTSTPAGIDPDYQRFIRGFDEVSTHYQQHVLALDPAVYYVMRPEEDGRTLRNEVGEDATATIHSPDPDHLCWAPGFDGGTAFHMNGTYSETYAVAEDYPKTPHDRLSVVAWVYAESRPCWASIAKNWQHGPEPGRRGQFHFGLHRFDGTLEAHVNDNDNLEQLAQEAVPLPLNRWHHVAMVADGAVLRLYRNGEEVASTPYNGLNGNPDIRPLAIGTKLGNDSMEPAVAQNGFWDGCIDHLAIFNKALTPDQIRELYEVGNASMRNYRPLP